MSDFTYAGMELELFATVRNWKAYWSSRIRPFVGGDILEVGAGIGSNTPFIDPGGDGRWVCLEPDPRLMAQLSKTLVRTKSRRRYETLCGTLQSLHRSEKFDSIVYVDVLEHIENDRQELETAADHLQPGGRITVLSPAHQFLFTPFDAAIGHFRRYDRPMLRGITPASLRLEELIYLDSVGLVLSLANLLLLRQSMPTQAQLRFWDRCVVPISRVLDKCLLSSAGKSIVGVWRK